MFRRKEFPRAPRQPLARIEEQRGVMRQSLPIDVEPIAKTKRFKSTTLREAYRLIACTWDDCGLKDGTVCCAHSNFTEFGGKSGARKADDSMAAALCHRHHSMLDQGNEMSYEEKKAMWLRAHNRSKDALILLAMDDPRLRKALALAGWVKP